MTTETLERLQEIAAPVSAYTCAGCGAVTAPDGTCLEIGACERADAAATRGASRVTAKATGAPAAWNVRGGVD